MGDMADMINDGYDEDLWVRDTSLSANRRWEFDCIIRQTDKAWLLKFESGFTSWFPKCCCSIKDHTLNLPRWLLIEKIDEYYYYKKYEKKVVIKLGDKKL